MNNRREPTISGLRPDSDETRTRTPAAKPSRPATGGGRSNNTGNSRPSPVANSRRSAKSASSPLAPIAFLFALVACGGAGYLYLQLTEAQKQVASYEGRLVELENKLTLTDDETSASAAQMQASLKEAHSEIRKLWGVSYDRNRKSIAENKEAAAEAKKAAANAAKRVESLSAEMRVIGDLVDAQQNALTGIEKNYATVSSQARKAAESSAALDRSVADIERRLQDVQRDIEAINGFRRSVNQQLLELKGGAQP